MMFLARMLRFLFWLVVVSWGVRLLGRVVNGMLGGGSGAGDETNTPAQGAAGSRPERSARKLLRDPVCGVHLAEVLAIPLRENGELLYFCSVACRDKYLADTKKIAANG